MSSVPNDIFILFYLVNAKIPTNIDRRDILTCYYNIGIGGVYLFIYILNGLLLIRYAPPNPQALRLGKSKVFGIEKSEK